MKRRHRPSLGLMVLLSLPCACEQTPTEAEVKKAGRAAGPAPLFLMPPEAAAVPVGGQLWTALRAGESWPGAPLAELGAAIEFSPVCFGGEQHLVEPVVRDGELGLALPVGASFRGDAVVGLATVPALDGEAGMLVSQHAKLCLHVRRGVFEAPVASPVVRHRFGFALEVVPLVDPLVLNVGDELPLRVHHDGRALPGIEVAAERQQQGGSLRQAFAGVTSPSGHVVLRIDATGVWLVRARHERPADESGPRQLQLATLVFRIGGGQ